MPKVTVLMPIYKGEKYLKESLDSILSQTFKDFEFLIINDCSPDNSAKIIQTYSDNRIKYLENESNIGLASTLNKGLNLAKGKYVVRMDQDDISNLKRIEKQVKFMDRNPEIDVCGSWLKVFGDMNFVIKFKPTHKQIMSFMFTSCHIAHPSVILRKQSFDKYNLRYNPDFKTAEDYELWSRASKYLLFANIQEPLLNYRSNSGQMTRSQDSMVKANQLILKMQLENTEINFDNEELIFHQLIMTNKYENINLDEFIKKANIWFDKILSTTNKKQNYENKIINKIIQQKCFDAIKPLIGTQRDLNIIKILNFKYLTFNNKLRLIYRHFRKKLKGK